jgi:type I restriction enzyme M protein
VRSIFLREFSEALLNLGVLSHFKLSGVVATWWSDGLADLKTLMENDFCGVVDGWIDAIADAVQDDDDVGPAFDPFSHKLVKRIMADYLQQIKDAKAEIARLKGEKEAFEQGNPPEDADEEELAAWNYAKDLERQVRELKAEFKDALKSYKALEKAAAKKKATETDQENAATAGLELQPYFDQLGALETDLAPYEQIKVDLTVARATFRTLTNAFVDELKRRCAALSNEDKQDLVLELFAHDLHTGLDIGVRDKQRELVQFVENLWDKYHLSLTTLKKDRISIEGQLDRLLEEIGYR